MPSALPATGFIGARLADGLGRAILSGVYGPGETLPGEIELAEQFVASRTLVREALKTLAAKGLIETRRKAGTRVRERHFWHLFDPEILAWRLDSAPERDFAEDLLAIRMAVEPAAAEAAARRHDAAAIAIIETAFADMERTVYDRNLFAQPDLRFHKAVLAASGNEFMVAFGALIETALAAFLKISMRHKNAPGPSLPLHGDILAAITRGDPEGARQAMTALLARTSDNIAHNSSR